MKPNRVFSDDERSDIKNSAWSEVKQNKKVDEYIQISEALIRVYLDESEAMLRPKEIRDQIIKLKRECDKLMKLANNTSFPVKQHYGRALLQVVCNESSTELEGIRVDQRSHNLLKQRSEALTSLGNDVWGPLETVLNAFSVMSDVAMETLDVKSGRSSLGKNILVDWLAFEYLNVFGEMPCDGENTHFYRFIVAVSKNLNLGIGGEGYISESVKMLRAANLKG